MTLFTVVDVYRRPWKSFGFMSIANKYLELQMWSFVWGQVKNGALGGAVRWGTALHAWRSRIRFPMVPLDMSNRSISFGVKATGAWGWHYHLHPPIVLRYGSLNLLEPSGPVQVSTENALPFTGNKHTCALPTEESNWIITYVATTQTCEVTLYKFCIHNLY